jgi:hypothetical protein
VRIAFLAGVVALLLLAPRAAHAIERQHHLGLAPTLGILDVKDKSTLSVGLGAHLHYAYGLTDQWNLTLEGGSVVVAAHQQQDLPDSPRNRPARVDDALVGASYVIDILRWVPYIGAQAGAYLLSGGTLPDALVVPGGAVTGGLDYQISRQIAVGLGARQHFLLTKLSTYPSYTTVVLRLEYMWGY